MPRLWEWSPVLFPLKSPEPDMTKLSFNAIGGVISIVALGAVLYFGAHTPPAVSTLAPTPGPQVLKPPLLKPQVKKPTPKRQLLKGKKIDCGVVPKVAHQFSKDQVLAAAKEYGLSPAQISALRVCLN